MSNSNGYYIELQLKPNAELSANFILSKLYYKLHLLLVKLQDKNGIVPVGVSFPEYLDKKSLGSKIRLFSLDESNLQNMNLNSELFSMSDYIHITDICRVPDSIEHVMFKRENVHSNNLIARRKAKRSGISEQEALNHLDKYKEVRIKTPYVNILSNSSRQRFKLFIQQQKVENLSYNGFNSYGLSINSTTVPCF